MTSFPRDDAMLQKSHATETAHVLIFISQGPPCLLSLHCLVWLEVAGEAGLRDRLPLCPSQILCPRLSLLPGVRPCCYLLEKGSSLEVLIATLCTLCSLGLCWGGWPMLWGVASHQEAEDPNGVYFQPVHFPASQPRWGAQPPWGFISPFAKGGFHLCSCLPDRDI